LLAQLGESQRTPHDKNPGPSEKKSKAAPKLQSEKAPHEVAAFRASAAQLMSALASSENEIVAFDRILRPRELITRQMESFLCEAFYSRFFGDGDPPPPPSKLLADLSLRMQCLQVLSSFAQVDTGAILRRVLTPEEGGDRTMTAHYAALFRDLCSDAVPGGRLKGTVMSPVSKRFLGNGMAQYASVSEIRALRSLLGRDGLGSVYLELGRLVKAKVASIGEFLAKNAVPLNELRQGQAGAALKGLDALLLDSVVIGNVIAIRRLSFEATREEHASKAPFVGALVSLTKAALNREDQTPALATFAHESCGFEDEAAHIDQLVKAAVAATPAAPWDLLPWAFAASFRADVWKATAYDPKNDVMQNNLHMWGPAMAQLFRCLPSKRGTSQAEAAPAEVHAEAFLEASAALILAMKSATRPPTGRPLRSMCIFLEKFVAETGIVRRGAFQDIMPYSIVHSSYVDVAAVGLK